MKKRYRWTAACCTALLCFGCGTDSDGILRPISTGSSTETTANMAETTAAVTETTAAETTTTAGDDSVTRSGDLCLIEGVPHLAQSQTYATACESLAATELLQYYGYDIDVDTFIEQYLPVADYPEQGEDGVLHAESPWNYFIGDPSRSNGYGCYSGAIETAVNTMVPGLAFTEIGTPLETLCKTYIDCGTPVIIWATIGMQPVQEGHSWFLPDGSWFTYLRPEHALVLVGYDADSYYFVDSLSDEEITAYDRADVETAYEALYAQAVVFYPKINASAGDA